MALGGSASVRVTSGLAVASRVTGRRGVVEVREAIAERGAIACTAFGENCERRRQRRRLRDQVGGKGRRIPGPGVTPSGLVRDRELRFREDRPSPGVERAAELGREPGQDFGPARVDPPIQDDLMELVLGPVDLGLATTDFRGLAAPANLGRQDGKSLKGLGVSRGDLDQGGQFLLFAAVSP